MLRSPAPETAPGGLKTGKAGTCPAAEPPCLTACRSLAGEPFENGGGVHGRCSGVPGNGAVLAPALMEAGEGGTRAAGASPAPITLPATGAGRGELEEVAPPVGCLLALACLSQFHLREANCRELGSSASSQCSWLRA